MPCVYGRDSARTHTHTHTHTHTPGHVEKVDKKLRAQTLSSSVGVHLRGEHGAHLVVVGKEVTYPLSILRPALGVKQIHDASDTLMSAKSKL